MKKILLILLCIPLFLFSNNEEQTTTIIVSGMGETIDEAKNNALRSAIEQAYGAFISAKTEIFNNQIVADQISSVSSGNIQSYEMLNEAQLPDGTWGVTLKALVSISKLISYVQAKGIAIEVKGGLFALNIKQQILNEEGEIKAITEMVSLLWEPMQTSFDYVIENGEPRSLDAKNINWEIPLVVTATTNKNMDFCANYFIKTLEAVSLSAAEVESYKTLNKDVFEFPTYYNGQTLIFYLRKENSQDALYKLMSQCEFFVRGFSVQSGLDQSEGNGEGILMIFDKVGMFRYPYGNKSSLKEMYLVDGISFSRNGTKVGTFSWNDKRTLTQIEQMTGYSVKPTGVRSQLVVSNGRILGIKEIGK